ncbi:hypothetical protein NL676_004767 [Syzygium grande]|nr:hypothetical protein NL676_004767 [Syzygium grande]
MSDSQSENRMKSRETPEVSDSGTIEQPLEKRGGDNAGRTSDKLPVRAKEEQHKDVVGKNLGNTLNMLKEAFTTCFGLFRKLPRKSESVMKDVSSQSREAPVIPSGPGLPSTFDQFPPDALEPVGFKVTFPKIVGGGAKDKGKGK